MKKRTKDLLEEFEKRIAALEQTNVELRAKLLIVESKLQLGTMSPYNPQPLDTYPWTIPAGPTCRDSSASSKPLDWSVTTKLAAHITHGLNTTTIPDARSS